MMPDLSIAFWLRDIGVLVRDLLGSAVRCRGCLFHPISSILLSWFTNVSCRQAQQFKAQNSIMTGDSADAKKNRETEHLVNQNAQSFASQ